MKSQIPTKKFLIIFFICLVILSSFPIIYYTFFLGSRSSGKILTESSKETKKLKQNKKNVLSSSETSETNVTLTQNNKKTEKRQHFGKIALPNLGKMNNQARKTAILVLTHNRPQYLKQTLASLSKLKGFAEISEIIVSKDGNELELATTEKEVNLFFENIQKNSRIKPKIKTPALKNAKEHKDSEENEGMHLEFIIHPRNLDPRTPTHETSAYIAQHYKWALDYTFLKRQNTHVVVVEDDIVPSPDFLVFFDRTVNLMDDQTEKIVLIFIFLSKYFFSKLKIFSKNSGVFHLGTILVTRT